MALTTIEPFGINSSNSFTFANVTATGNITGNFFIGNGSQLTGLPESYSNANVAAYLPTYTGNISADTITANTFTGNISGGSNTAGTVTASAQPNITSVGTLTSVSVSGNIDGGNIAGNGAGLTSIAGANVTGTVANATYATSAGSATSATTADTVTTAAQPNITSVGTLTSLSSSGNITGAYFIGNGSQLTGLPESYANANVAAYLPTYTGNLVSLQGNVTTTANISASHVLGNGSGLSSITGANVTGQVANALVAGTVYTAAQPNITSVGTLSSVSVSGNVAAGNIASDAHVAAATLQTTGNAIIGGDLVVNGNTIQVNIDQLNVQDPIIGLGRGANNAPLTVNDGKDRGTEMWYYTDAEKSAFVGYQNSTGNIIAASNISMANEIVTVNSYGNFVAGNVIGATVSATGNITANYFVGNGSQLTGLPESYGNANVAAYLPTYTGNLVSLQGNVTTTANVSGNFFIGNGSQLTGLPASGLTWTTQANAAPAGPAPGDFWYDAYTGVKYQYINDGTSNIWVDQSFPTSFSTLAVAGNATIGGNLGVTGNITGNYFVGNGSQLTGMYSNTDVQAYLPTYTGNLVSLTGNVTTTANITGGNVLTSGLITATGNITGGNLITAGLLSVSSITKTGSNGVGNIGAVGSTFNTVFAKATSAQYADLAEIYRSDQAYEPGTVLVFGGTQEVTTSDVSHDIRIAGVVSTAPAYLMNNQTPGVAVALTGRVPCQVRGPVAKGEQLVNIEPGIAGAVDFAQYRPGCVIGKSLETIADSAVHTIEIAVGRY